MAGYKSSLVLYTVAVAAVAVALIPSAYAVEVVFFSDKDFRGQQLGASIGSGNCYNLPGSMNDKVSSINTNGQCIIVFGDAGCFGKSARIHPGSSGHNDLSQFNFNDEISSARAC